MAQLGDVMRQMYINGQWVEAKSGKTFPVIYPASGETLTTVPDAGVEDVRSAIHSAQAAFKT